MEEEYEEELDSANTLNQPLSYVSTLNQPLYANPLHAPLPGDFDDMDFDVESKKRNRDVRNEPAVSVPNPIAKAKDGASKVSNVPIAGEVPVEQESEVLMEGRQEVWAAAEAHAQGVYDPYTADAGIDRKLDAL